MMVQTTKNIKVTINKLKMLLGFGILSQKRLYQLPQMFHLWTQNTLHCKGFNGNMGESQWQ